ncbi:uncharacterized protein BDW43DRAFT_310938 [Aspergillus alliaceus]|uniref:uncharacterized protein n=1 Tax=Petromyces alliaceus TaxID=209559 RepID=UPI0012A3BF68|nr:uncharacterized protein BDW43DRAFT_310938 [Aspergillus alliaceus]KAB8233580.1 hypothetical protein BDW43DRAFT_310938 [Aspergillus alliaceus]
MPIPTRSLSLREPRKQPGPLGRSTSIRTVSTRTKPTADGIPSNPTTGNENLSTRNKSFLPVRDDSRSTSPLRPQPQQDSGSTQRLEKPEQGKLSAPTLASRRRSLIRPSPVKTTPSPAKATAPVSSTPKRATFAPVPPSPAKQNGPPRSPKKTEMPPPPRPTRSRSTSLRQPASSSSGPPTPRGHVRHRSQVITPATSQVSKKTGPPSAPSTPRTRTQLSTYQQHLSPKKPVKPSLSAPSADATAELDLSLVPSTAPEVAALQTELLQLSLLHLSSLREDTEWKGSAERQLRTKYDAVAEQYRGVVTGEKEYQQQLNGQALHCWLKNSIEHNGRQVFAEQIQVLSQVAQEVCDLSGFLGGRYTLAVQEFESWFRKAEEIKTCRRYQGGSDLVIFIDPLDHTWKEEVHTLTLKLELCSRQLQSLDILGYGEVERLQGSSLYRTAKGLDDMVNSMIEEMDTIRKIEADIVRSERQWVSQLSQQVASTKPLEKRVPRVGMWRS